MKPVTPKELAGTAGQDIPEVVIEAVNNLLKKKFRRGGPVTLKQEDIVKEIVRLNHELNATTIYENGWLDFEPVFERAGWRVNYDKPGYNESYPATFEFTPKK
jgi:hypothetical protein